MPEAAPVPIRRRAALATVGFLGNVCVEKGVLDFLDVMAALREEGGTVQGRLAGPIDPPLERELRARLRRLPCVDYVGPQYGAAKAAFLSGLDALVFPTRYANEAEPLTVLEALMHGVPVIAYGRGCIPEVLTPACGRVVHPEQSFLAVALRQLRAWQRSPVALRAASVAAAARFDELRSRSEQSLAALMEELAPWPR
jgi:glycosyltransferase involved in cell wall biosynthesis